MPTNNEEIVLAGGCFWCTEEIFLRVPGVLDVVSGYSGGDTEYPSYEDVSTGNTNHAECVKVTFDSSKIKLEKLLLIFFKTHNPTTLNYQGNDYGTQYRSAIFYTTENQRAIIQKVIDKIKDENIYENNIVTEVLPLKNFYRAEDYHQKFYRKNPNYGYCSVVINPKLDKLKELLV
ncbi:peptide-methionine (S)-S-oxide reductase [bacterium]|nr:peptide-methionine (S)-S-oxide reductase [bacterium]